jgi:V/A-type H+/Na+-transporting ATPase subunit E
MGLDAIVEEIKATGKVEADRIERETAEEVTRITSEASSQAARIKTAQQEAAKKEIERIKMQEMSGAALEVKRALLNSRKELLDEVNDKAKEIINKLPADKNQKLLKSIIDKNQANNSRIYSAEKDKPMVKSLTKLNHAGNMDCIGGVIIENETGTEYLDFRYEIILKNVSERSLKQVSDILFG